MYLADAEDRNVALLENVEQHRFGRVDGIVVTARRADKVCGGSCERASDYAADAVLSI